MKRRPRQETPIGLRSGKLVILSDAPDTRDSYNKPVRMITVKCDCGTIRNHRRTSFLRQLWLSCGCERSKNILKAINKKSFVPKFKPEKKLIKLEVKESNIGFMETGLISGILDESYFEKMFNKTYEYCGETNKRYSHPSKPLTVGDVKV